MKKHIIHDKNGVLDGCMEADGWYLDHGCLVFFELGLTFNTKVPIEAYAKGEWTNVFAAEGQ